MERAKNTGKKLVDDYIWQRLFSKLQQQQMLPREFGHSLLLLPDDLLVLLE
jgi:hypothetical protein